MATLFRLTIEAGEDGTWSGKVEWPFRGDASILGEVYAQDGDNAADWVHSYTSRLRTCLRNAFEEYHATKEIAAHATQNSGGAAGADAEVPFLRTDSASLPHGYGAP